MNFQAIYYQTLNKKKNELYQLEMHITKIKANLKSKQTPISISNYIACLTNRVVELSSEIEDLTIQGIKGMF